VFLDNLHASRRGARTPTLLHAVGPERRFHRAGSGGPERSGQRWPLGIGRAALRVDSVLDGNGSVGHEFNTPHVSTCVDVVVRLFDGFVLPRLRR